MTSEQRLANEMLNRLADVLSGFNQNLDSVRQMHGMEAGAGSQVANELAEEHQIATEELHRPILDAYGLATTMMWAATDHLVVLGDAIKPPPRPFAPQTLARQGVELLARAFCLMEPNIGPLDRAGRFVTEMLYSLWETKKWKGTMEDGSRPEAKEDQLLRWAKQVGVSCHQKDSRWWVGDSDRPGSTRAVSNMMGEEIGGVGYHIFSSPSHGVVGGLVDRLEPEGELVSDEDQVVVVSVSASDIALVTSWTIMGCLPAFERYFAAHGWEDDSTRAWRLHALKTSREFGENTGLFNFCPAS